MVEIKLIDNKEDWNNGLKKTINYSVFSSYEWGEYKKNSWKVERLAFYKSGNFLGQSQFLLKEKFFFILSWNSGGLNLVNLKYLESIILSINEYYKNKKFNVRFNFYDENNGNNLFEISKFLKVPTNKINSGFSINHNLEKNMDYTKQMNSNHRYYYKKALKNDLNVEFGSKELITSFLSLHNQMTKSKELENLKINEDDLRNLAKYFGDNFLIELVYLNKEIVSGCLILLFEDSAFYYLAASNELGRKAYSSYLMINELFLYLSNKNINKFDFAGITPYNENAFGVNKFKIGFGGKVVNYIGEYEIYNNGLINKVFNKFIG